MPDKAKLKLCMYLTLCFDDEIFLQVISQLKSSWVIMFEVHTALPALIRR